MSSKVNRLVELFEFGMHPFRCIPLAIGMEVSLIVLASIGLIVQTGCEILMRD